MTNDSWPELGEIDLRVTVVVVLDELSLPTELGVPRIRMGESGLKISVSVARGISGPRGTATGYCNP